MNKKQKIFTLILSLILTLIIATVAVFAQSDEEETVKPVIAAKTLVLENTVGIYYAVDFGDIPAGAEYGLLCWETNDRQTEPPSELTHENAASAVNLTSYDNITISGKKYRAYTYSDLAAKQMTDYVYAVAYMRYPGETEYTYSDVSKYSIMQYVLSQKNEKNAALLEAMLEYGAKAQVYFNYKLDRLANEAYVLGNFVDATLSDGTNVGVFKPGEAITLNSTATMLLDDATLGWYVVSDDGKSVIAELNEDGSLPAPSSKFTASPTVVVISESFDSLTNNSSGTAADGEAYFKSGGGFSTVNKPTESPTSYFRLNDEGEGKYVTYTHACGSSGTDGQIDTTNSTDPQPHMYDPNTGTYASTALTYTIKLKRTDADVAASQFRLRRYNSSGKSSVTADLFTLTSAGVVRLGSSIEIGNLTEAWQTFSFVVDFALGSADGADNVFAYREGHLVASTRIDAFNLSCITYSEATASTERLQINFYTQSTAKNGVTCFDDISVTLGSAPINEEPGGVIVYDTNGASLPLDAPTKYSYSTPTVLPENLTKDGYSFDGWYTSQSYETRITEIPAERAGIVKVYAKFSATSEYLESLVQTNSAFSNESFAAVDTTNQYNLSSSLYINANGGLYDGYTGGTSSDPSAFTLALEGKKDNYNEVEYGETVTMSTYAVLPTDKYSAPLGTPEGKSHPYLYFTKDQISAIREMLEDPDMDEAVATFWEYANTQNFTGIFEETVDSERGNVPYRYNSTNLAIIEAKAFAYVITGEKAYGYEAIIGAKNAMLTIVYHTKNHMDPYHGPAYVLDAVTKVFDWCYDLMTDEDKEQFVLGVQNRLVAAMEFNPFQLAQGLSSAMPDINYISGHGAGPQFIKMFVNMALAFYTEETSWWSWVGGKYFDEYVKVYDEVYKSGWVSQGTAGYGNSKYFYALISAFTIHNATGIYPSHTENAQQGAYFLLAHVNGADKYFSTGDGQRSPDGNAVSHEYLILAAALYNDPALYTAAKHYSSDFSKFYYGTNDDMTAPMTIILSSYISSETKELYQTRGDGVPLIQYFGEGNGVMSARDSWSSDAAVVLMKIGEMTMANHDISDHGTFQIYYKGLLAGTSGAYKEYGSNVHKYYLQATVAHNGLLVFDPGLADDEPIWSCGKTEAEGHIHTAEDCSPTWGCGKEESSSHTHTATGCSVTWGCGMHVHDLTTCSISNASRYFYSGSQYQRSEARSLTEWLDSGNYDMGTVTGNAYEYNSDGSPKYAYIAGDITKSYSASTVDYVGRRMLTVYTGNEDYPMMFFVFDTMTSVEGGEDFTKTFLLHTNKEPEISEDGMSAEVQGAAGGKLTLNIISGADEITKVGGEGQAYWINGKNCVDLKVKTDNAASIWGRLEINMTGKLTDNLLTAMYVSDTDKNITLSTTKLDADSGIAAARVANTVAAFVSSTERAYSEFTVNSGDDGAILEYYISGVATGTWNIYVDGAYYASAAATKDGGLLSFTAPAGEILVVPGDDVANIIYEVNGGTLPDNTTTLCGVDETVTLTTQITKGKDIFMGWYTTESFEEGTKITEIVGSEIAGPVVVYAKWAKCYVNTDFTGSSLEVTSAKNGSYAGITMHTSGKTNATITTKSDANGKTYVEWIKGSADSFWSSSNTTDNFSKSSATEVSFMFSFAALDSYTPTAMQIRMNSTSPITGKVSGNLIFIKTNTSGDVYLGDNKVKLGNYYGNTDDGTTIEKGKIFTVRVVVDFKNELLKAYDANGKKIAETAMVLPQMNISSSESTETPSNALEWKNYLTNYLFYWYTNGDSSNQGIAVYGVTVADGNIFV